MIHAIQEKMFFSNVPQTKPAPPEPAPLKTSPVQPTPIAEPMPIPEVRIAITATFIKTI